jgi:hypothetical protein
MIKYVFFALMAFSLLSCDTKPKLVSPADMPQTGSDGELIEKSENTPVTNDSEVHEVVANEILQSDRYTYMKVTEKGRSFWIATAKRDAEKGKKYIYQDGLMKVNFESVEFKRTFDTIYLVSQVLDSEQHPGNKMPATAETTAPANNNAPANSNVPINSNAPAPKVRGAIKLADLFKNMTKYNGKTVKVTGKVIKVNNGIMGRNWVHIREEGFKSDLTITTNEIVTLGENVAFEGKIANKKDFGSGYFYDLIMEEGKRL